MIPSGKKFYTQNEYVGISNSVFNFNFLALIVSEILWVPNSRSGCLRTLDALWRRNFRTISEYFTISNCVFNFSFLSLVLYEILGGPQFTLGALRSSGCPLANNYTQNEYFGISISVFNFDILAVVVFEILRGSQIHTREAYAPLTPSIGKIFVP